MSDVQGLEAWSGGQAYERYVGRWSQPVAQAFLAWLGPAPGGHWLDVGCGTGALSRTILAITAPASVTGIDRSEHFVAFAREHVVDARARFEVGDAQALSVESAAYDAAISGLVLNFVAEPQRMAAEMARAVRPGGVVGVYVWDYADRMEFMRCFWDAAVALDPGARGHDEGIRFPICHPERLAGLFRDVGLTPVQTCAIDVTTEFTDFDDYWLPFLGGQGPASGYLLSLEEDRQAALRERIRSALPVQSDGSIRLTARAWAVRGERR